MKSPQVSPLAQIEWTIGDLAAAKRLLESLFEVQSIEEEFSAALEGPHMDIVHLGLGQTVLQFCKPLIDATGHWKGLERSGPHVYNLTYFVDDLSLVLDRCAAAKLDLEWHFPLGEIYKRVLPPDNLAGSLEAAMVHSAPRLGFNLELAETPWAREPEPRLFYPAYHPDWPNQGDRVGPLECINVETSDVDGALSALTAVFGDAALITMPVTSNESEDVLEAVVELGRVRIHYIQSTVDPSGVGSASEARVHSLALPVIDLEEVEAIAKNLGLSVEGCPAYLFEPMQQGVTTTKRINTMDVLGIDLVVR